MEEILLRNVNYNDLVLIFSWRNSEKVRRWMYNSDEISWEDHKSWFEKLSTSSDYLVKICEYKGKPYGIISYKNINEEKGNCTWGFYIGEPNYPRGLGKMLGYAGLNFAFYNLQVKTVYGEVLVNNKSSINFHKKLGFKQHEFIKKHYIHPHLFKEIYTFSLNLSEWEIIKNNLFEKEVGNSHENHKS
ncbi:UDP-4-amino-4,6-dideoxy-N-acetyl-beta-L-altrosamine N-acetyltransferase [Priestia megaterium]|uniref:UDP-4-amino-4, 6-dideoxy-N-acetyl-beta-L-altrosamine N-acetyltransferase n=1 Tax=Priestia megaterium TaxID=1404 RepID=UPI00077D7974|nr:UDP-4-amino-4,6-dideoxy-N-acetyl-beta-L-altrosamine N-acetyltransferase [Priestia megaterium]USL39496.1 UDP-4-amino-4,6-dideoxy-N-acetyl-beta-L-altrosamine N-acetyltransferase [Priestia megaterium]